MSDVPPRPAAEAPQGDPDAWAAACAEDLAEERARRRARYGPAPGESAEELRRLADALTERIGRLGASLGPGAAMAAGPLAAQARAALDPVIERNAEVLGHLAGAGRELLAAYRAAVLGHEQRWARPDDRADGGRGGDRKKGDGRGGAEDDGPPERIDLD